MLLYQIGPGKIVAGGQVAPDGSAHYDNSDGEEDTWLVGMFWGANDTQAVLDEPSASGTFQDLDVKAEHQHFEIYAVEKTQLNPPAGAEISLIDYTPNTRTAENRYTGWLDPASWAPGTYQKLLSGVSTYFQFTGQAYDNQQFQGDTIVFFNIDENDPTGLWNYTWGTQAILTDPDGNLADAYMSWDLDPSGQDWDTYSSDQGGVYVIPEPMTMAGLMLGIGSLVGYIRRRR